MLRKLKIEKLENKNLLCGDLDVCACESIRTDFLEEDNRAPAGFAEYYIFNPRVQGTMPCRAQDLIVDWGDGNVQSVIRRGLYYQDSNTTPHHYENYGRYNVVVTFILEDGETIINEHVLDYKSPGDMNGDYVTDLTDRDLYFDSPRFVEAQGAELETYMKDLFEIAPGDSSLDGVFSSEDLILIFQRGHYNSGEFNRTWMDGDWNGDGWVNEKDLILAFQQTNYSN